MGNLNSGRRSIKSAIEAINENFALLIMKLKEGNEPFGILYQSTSEEKEAQQEYLDNLKNEIAKEWEFLKNKIREGKIK